MLHFSIVSCFFLATFTAALLLSFVTVSTCIQTDIAFVDLIDQQVISKEQAKAASLALSSRHFEKHGAKWPSVSFSSAVRSASLDVTLSDNTAHGYRYAHSVVLMAMANDMAMKTTVPLFVQSLNNMTSSVGNEGTVQKHVGSRIMSNHLVLICSSSSAFQACHNLGLAERCVEDLDMALGNKSLPFHTIGFNMIGFAKIKYILNTISLGHDVIFMDTDVVVFQNFIPYILGIGADIAALVEKCRVVDDRLDYSRRAVKDMPLFNIGVTYFRSSSPGVTRCVHSWLFDMRMEVRDRPRVWDQDVFKKVMFHCTKDFQLRLHTLSPRRFFSYCHKPCGCSYSDQDVLTKIDKYVRPSKSSMGGTCNTSAVRGWLLSHFPCAGEAENKALLMEKFSSMFQTAGL
ncbi:hypothetical protein CEUSTIGMA_g1169.t1 [Chlamydomonas eustigma]|uniref:Glycosyltransferase n=1 Tax=Chlamydomonas eustigma TaxID=1157962 RepID=A0A250WSJ9_9CHLO|nr:hypothetical protein CEUSTIGMA_g1169.t1 [Chlamydomonas eustigma]|eukprot:GAX73716.1 hypothetical protein CEUSTIGMA_g1169.t1 [Chlamydomonas eustigma]